jgi:hypothetical protein
MCTIGLFNWYSTGIQVSFMEGCPNPQQAQNLKMSKRQTSINVRFFLSIGIPKIEEEKKKKKKIFFNKQRTHCISLPGVPVV